MMDDRALLGLGPQADGFAHQQALQYFEQLKNTCDGWQMCCTALASGTYEDNDHVKFFCLQVIEHYLKTRYASDSTPAPENVKAFLLASLQTQASSVVKDKPFLRNKLAQLFALAFRADYTHRWPSFFVDLLQSLSLGERVVDVYVHILMAIDSDVVDREIVHTLQETELNTMLKDAMRLQDVAQLVDSWYQIITTYQSSRPVLTCLCLEVIGAYVSWIDINLIANERFVTVLLHFMTRPLLRESACDCIAEIISKGMEPFAKVKLIESFTSMLSGAGVFNVTEQDDEYDFLVKLAKLVNIIGLQLVLCWQKQVKLGDAAGAKMSLVALEDKVVLLVKFLGNDDDDVSGMVAEFSHSYIGVLKQMAPPDCRQKETIKELLCVVIKKMKYDESYNFEREREDEAAFQEYRKELKVIFNNIGALDPHLVLLMVHEVISQTMQQWQTAKFYDVEVAISLLYNLGEAIPASHGQHFSGDPSKVSALQQMLRIMLDSQVSRYQHSAVTLQFFETIVRYDRFFNLESQYIPDVLIAFLDERGLRSQSAHLCSRAAYLFSKFVKAINKPHLQNYLDDVLSRIQDLLILNSPGNGLKQYLNPDDQLFIYETASILIVQSQFPAEKKQALMKQMLAPIVSKFSDLLRSMSTEVDETKQLEYANCLSHAMAFASRASKGFSSQQTMKQCGCVEAYTETLGIFLHALNAPTQRQLMHAGVRQFLHRMVVCLGTEVLPFIPIAMESLLKNTDVRELHDFIPLINQVVSKFKKHIVPFLQEVFMPIVSAIFRVLSTPADERDQVAAVEKRMLQRGYFSFIATLVNNNVTEVLSNQDTANFQQVLLTLIQGAVDIPDPQGQKTCFNILKRLVEVWANEKSPLAGFNEFMYKNIVPACFLAPMKPTFDLADAQTVLTLNECASCLKTIQDQRGDELTQFLLSTYLPTLNLSAELIQEFCQALKSDPKIFRNYLKQFFTRAKS